MGTRPFRVMTGWILGLAILFASVVPPVAHAQRHGTVHQYLTRNEALQEVFPNASQYVRDTLRMDATERKEAEQALHRELPDSISAYPVTLCYDAEGAFVGYAMTSEEIGKYRPITFMIGVTPAFEVKKVVVMVYREDRGEEVRTPRFLYQYEGKTTQDPIRLHRDIVNISGATLSVRAMNAGVRKVLYLIGSRYRSSPPPSTYEEQQTPSDSADSGSP